MGCPLLDMVVSLQGTEPGMSNSCLLRSIMIVNFGNGWTDCQPSVNDETHVALTDEDGYAGNA